MLRLNVNCQCIKVEKSAEIGKSALCNHYRKDCVRQKLSIDVKSRGEFWQGARYSHGLKLYLHSLWSLLMVKKKNNNYTVKKSVKLWPHKKKILSPMRNKLASCISSCDSLRRTQHYLGSVLAKNKETELKLHEKK